MAAASCDCPRRISRKALMISELEACPSMLDYRLEASQGTGGVACSRSAADLKTYLKYGVSREDAILGW